MHNAIPRATIKKYIEIQLKDRRQIKIEYKKICELKEDKKRETKNKNEMRQSKGHKTMMALDVKQFIEILLK